MAQAAQKARHGTPGHLLRHRCASGITIRQWALDDVDGFQTQYSRARELGYLAMGDDLLEIADDSGDDKYTDADGAARPDHAAVARARLRVDTRKWVLSKMLPKVYSDRLTAEVKTPVDEDMSSNDLARELAFALALQMRRQERGWAPCASRARTAREATTQGSSFTSFPYKLASVAQAPNDRCDGLAEVEDVDPLLHHLRRQPERRNRVADLDSVDRCVGYKLRRSAHEQTVRGRREDLRRTCSTTCLRGAKECAPRADKDIDDDGDAITNISGK